MGVMKNGNVNEKQREIFGVQLFAKIDAVLN